MLGVVLTLILGLPYVTTLAEHASDAQQAATPPAPDRGVKLSPGTQRMISSKSVNIAPGQIAFIETRAGRAVLKFETSKPSFATYHWRSFSAANGGTLSGSGSITRKPGEGLLMTLTLGAVSVDWLGGGTDGTLLYFQPPHAFIEPRPAAEFKSLDLNTTPVR